MKKQQKEVQMDSAAPIVNDNVCYTRKNNDVTIKSGNNWYIRLWYTISNVFTYIFKGYIRY
jgi:hypothetical protein